jgi:formylglycine-generating enzyme required for sulfatase activity
MMNTKHNEKWTRSLSAGVLVTALLLAAGCKSVPADKTGSALPEPVNEVKDQEIASLEETVSPEEAAAASLAAEERKKQELAKRAEKNREVSLPEGGTLELIWIEPGTYTMGSFASWILSQSPQIDLKPIVPHDVTLEKEYWLGKYEVTQGQYEAIMGKNPSHFKGSDLPVDSVSWFDAREFCKKLTAFEKEAGRLPEGYEYSLPTEAQWEYGCRAGISEKFLLLRDDKDSKEEEDKEVLFGGGFWSDLNSGNKSHPVGQLRPNVWGLYDMSGNVWEWCLDMYNPKESVKSSFRAYRGGSWFSSLMNCRCVSRRSNSPGYQNIDLGFRVALVPVE